MEAHILFSVRGWSVIQLVLCVSLLSLFRRNEPISRPHSWHSTKFNENQSETAKTQTPPTPVWDTRYDAR